VNVRCLCFILMLAGARMAWAGGQQLVPPEEVQGNVKLIVNAIAREMEFYRSEDMEEPVPRAVVALWLTLEDISEGAPAPHFEAKSPTCLDDTGQKLELLGQFVTRHVFPWQKSWYDLPQESELLPANRVLCYFRFGPLPGDAKAVHLELPVKHFRGLQDLDFEFLNVDPSQLPSSALTREGLTLTVESIQATDMAPAHGLPAQKLTMVEIGGKTLHNSPTGPYEQLQGMEIVDQEGQHYPMVNAGERMEQKPISFEPLLFEAKYVWTGLFPPGLTEKGPLRIICKAQRHIDPADLLFSLEKIPLPG
jgi:hypothetical protein